MWSMVHVQGRGVPPQPEQPTAATGPHHLTLHRRMVLAQGGEETHGHGGGACRCPPCPPSPAAPTSTTTSIGDALHDHPAATGAPQLLVPPPALFKRMDGHVMVAPSGSQGEDLIEAFLWDTVSDHHMMGPQGSSPRPLRTYSFND